MKALSLIFLSLFTLSMQALAGCLDLPRLTGVNVAGAESNSSVLPGEFGKNYIYPTLAELSFLASQKVTVIRLPVRWERVQTTLKGPLNPLEIRRLQETIHTANNLGMCVMIDIHNYAKYFGTPLSGNAALQDGFVDVWLKLAAEFTNADTTILDLMNEPKYIPIAEWGPLAKRTVAELRKAKAKNMIVVSGGKWSGLHDWFSLSGEVSNATAFADLRDPLNRTILQVHQYVDEDYSGTTTVCRPPEKFDNMFSKITQWAKDNQQQLFLGEFGTPTTTECLATLDKMLSLMNDPVWRGFTYWAVGRWWNNYPLALNLNSTATTSPQWAILKKYFQQPLVKKSAPKPPTVDPI
jgi:endoglucanase